MAKSSKLILLLLTYACLVMTCWALGSPDHHHHFLRGLEETDQQEDGDEDDDNNTEDQDEGLVSPATVLIDGSRAIAQTRPNYINLNVEYFAATYPPLSHPKVRFLISQLAPATLRIGGNSADTVTYAVNSTWEAMCSDYPGDCFTPSQYHDVMTFSHAVGWKVLFNLNEYWTYKDPVVDPDTAPRTHRPGPFKNENNRAMLEYMADNDLVPALVSLGNELCDNLDPQTTAADYKELYDTLLEIWPDETKRPTLIGPDAMWINQTWAKDLVSDEAYPPLDIFAWHMYLLNRTAEVEHILDPAILDTEALWVKLYQEAFEEAGKPQELWLTETGVAWGGELNGTADRFVGGFWWLDQLAYLATYNVTLQHRHTIHAYTEGWASSFLGTIEDNFSPRPDYWTSLLWGKLVGTKVLKATKTEGDANLRVYAHCAKWGGGVTLVVINLSSDTTYELQVQPDEQALHGDPTVQQLYLLSAPTFDSKELLLNGESLTLSEIDENNFAFLGLVPEEQESDVVEIPPLTYGFVVLPLVEAYACSA